MIRWLCLALTLLLATPARAHLTPNSEVSLDFGRDVVTGTAIIPLGEFDYARGTKLRLDAQGQPAEDIRPYLAARIGATSHDGRAWQVTVGPVRAGYDAGPADLRFPFTITPPPGASTRAFRFDWRPVIDSVPSHFVLVLARSDFLGGLASKEPQLIGAIQGGPHPLEIDRGTPSLWRGFAASVLLGMHHIAGGYDHLLFLLTLLLPAPLVAAGARWGGYGGARYTLKGLVRVVTAFTIGHSLTLIGGAAFGWNLPQRPVEAGIALSILISALHAFRPLFPRREALIAGGFGLIHGMAFATLIGAYGLGMTEKGLAILGFNLGIELVQLAVVAVVAPILFLLAPRRVYTPARVIGAAVSVTLASIWLVLRLL